MDSQFYIKKNRDLTFMGTPKQDYWQVRKIFDARKQLNNSNVVLNMQVITARIFNIKKLYSFFNPQLSQVTLKNLVFFKGHIPRHRFILWLGIHHCLTFIDRLTKQGIQVSQYCVLCKSTQVETLDQLLFECSYSRYIWSSILQQIGIVRQMGSWNEEIHLTASNIHKN